MDHEEAARYWEGNAAAWTQLARAGYDVYRDLMNTPAFLALLPDVRGLAGLDIGCGEGNNTRLVAGRGARMTAIDAAPTFVAAAVAAERERPLGIDYRLANAVALPFADGAFDFAVSTMCLMDMPEPDRAIREAFRVLRPGGFLQFSICHPCFMTPLWRWAKDEAGNRIGVVCGDYFDNEKGRIEEWSFNSAPEEARRGLPKFKAPQFCFTLSWWMSALLDAGFALERLNEPRVDEETARRAPDVADTRIVAFFLHVRVRRPG